MFQGFSRTIKAYLDVEDLKLEDYDSAVIHGGFGLDKLRTNKHVLSFIKSIINDERIFPIIYYGPKYLSQLKL